MPLSREELQRRVDVRAKFDSLRLAAIKLGINRDTLRSSLERAAREGVVPTAPPEIELPPFPNSDIPVEDKIAWAAKRFEVRKASFEAHTWFPVKIKGDLPIALLFVGDPHLDDDGCDWTTLLRHVEIAKQPGIYGVNIGDTTNNWTGRLARLYGKQEASASTAREYAEWFMLDCGIIWLLILLGNHDDWEQGSAWLMQMAKRFGTHKLVCHDWEARFSLVFKNGWEPRIFAAHDFKGSSIWNIMHGLIREGQIGEEADLYVAGHKHCAGETGFENVSRGRRYQHFVRVRGYKFFDDHARRSGFKEQSVGCSALVVFDPKKRAISKHVDVEEGADYLAFLRGRA